MANRVRTFFGNQPVGSVGQRTIFIALAVLLFLFDAAGEILGSPTADGRAMVTWGFVMCSALVLAGFFPATGGTLLVITAVLVNILSVDLSVCMFGLYVVVADWIARKWYVAAGSALLVVDGAGLIFSEIPLGYFYSLGMGWFFAISVGLTMRWQKTRVSKLEQEMLLSDQAALAAREQVYEELAAALHDTVARNLVRLHVTSQSLVGSGLPSSDAKLIESLVIDTLQNVRTLMRQARPTVVDENLQAVVATCQTMLDVRKIRLNIDIPADADPMLTRMQRETLALVILEGATNILKHAPEKSEATLVLEMFPEEAITLTIANAISDTAAIPGGPLSGGFGLANLSSRISRDGGSLFHWERDDKWILTAELPATSTASFPTMQEKEQAER